MDPTRRAERMLAAADASLQAGAFDAALALAAAAEDGALEEFQRARVDLVRGNVAFASGAIGDGALLLLKAASRLEPFDLDLARDTYLIAWRAAIIAGHGQPATRRIRVTCRDRRPPHCQGGQGRQVRPDSYQVSAHLFLAV